MSLLDKHWATQAAAAIDSAIDDATREHRVIDQSTARLIVASLPVPEHGALAQFAYSGRLNRAKALAELENLRLGSEHESWAGALWDYLDQPRLLRQKHTKEAA
jgi:hypothetical protein